MHFMNGAGVCSIINRTVFNVYIRLNHTWRYKHNQIEKFYERPRHQKTVFSKFRQFLYLSFSWVVKVPFLKLLLKIFYQSFIAIVLKTVIFTTFWRLESVLWQKIIHYILRLVYLFFPKISKSDFRKAFIKNLLDNIWYALSFSVHNIPCHVYDLVLAWSDCY